MPFFLSVGSGDPDPDLNETNPQHGFLVKELRRCVHKPGETEFTDEEMETFHAALNTIVKYAIKLPDSVACLAPLIQFYLLFFSTKVLLKVEINC